MKHLVIGHDQILCCEDTTGEVGVEIDFIYVSGTIQDIVERIRREMNLSRCQIILIEIRIRLSPYWEIH